jgi:hypothetical protein
VLTSGAALLISDDFQHSSNMEEFWLYYTAGQKSIFHKVVCFDRRMLRGSAAEKKPGPGNLLIPFTILISSLENNPSITWNDDSKAEHSTSSIKS